MTMKNCGRSPLVESISNRSLIPVVVVVVVTIRNRSSGSRICEVPVVFVMEAVLVARSTMPGRANFRFSNRVRAG
jgi:hypothetical protein